MLKKIVDRFSKSPNSKNGISNIEAAIDEPAKSNVSVEVAKQRERIDRLQNTVEDQTRLLREIFHQMKQIGPQASSVESGRD